MRSYLRNGVSTVSAIALLVGAWCPASLADTRGAKSAPAETSTPAAKAGRGLAAITTPFLEIPGNILETSRRDGAVAGWSMGLARGLGMAIVRPVVGVYELVTAPFPAPRNYEPIMQPEYPWSYFGTGSGDSGLARR